MMPDPAFYIECLQSSYDELKAATIGTARPAKKKRPVKKKATKKAAPRKSGNGAVQTNNDPAR
jgi:hypothetical protein